MDVGIFCYNFFTVLIFFKLARIKVRKNFEEELKMTNEIFRNERIANDESLFTKFFTSAGRIDRTTFFLRLLAVLMIEFSLLFATGFVALLANLSLENPPLWMNLSFEAVFFAAIIPKYFLNVKRLHDIGKDSTLAKIFWGVEILSASIFISTINGILILSSVLSIASLVFTFYLLFKRGENNANEYGNAQ